MNRFTCAQYAQKQRCICTVNLASFSTLACVFAFEFYGALRDIIIIIAPTIIMTQHTHGYGHLSGTCAAYPNSVESKGPKVITLASKIHTNTIEEHDLSQDMYIQTARTLPRPLSVTHIFHHSPPPPSTSPHLCVFLHLNARACGAC